MAWRKTNAEEIKVSRERSLDMVSADKKVQLLYISQIKKIMKLENFEVPENILNSFGIKEKPALLSGGQGDNYKAGDIVLKRVENASEYEWIAETLNSITQTGFRVPRYLKSINGNWVENGWIAYKFVEGEHEKNNWEKKFKLCEKFHDALKNLPCPDFISKRNNPWAIADRVVWGKQTITHHQLLQEQLSKLQRLLKPINLPNQIIHGDFTGNILFHAGLPPAIIDFTPYYRPKHFAKAIMFVDAITWEGAAESIFELVKDLPEIKQLVIRAEMRRLIEIEECAKYFQKGSLEEIEAHKPLIEFICNNFQ